MISEEIDMVKLKKMSKKERTKKIDEFEEKKTVLIKKYMEFQDLLDDYNKRVYDISCEIEQINIVIRELSPKKNL